MTDDAKPLDRWLGHQTSSAGVLLARAQRLAEVNRALQTQWASEPWVQSLRVANIRGNTIVIYAQTATAMVPLRYRREALLAFLNQRFGLRCTDIDAKVRPAF